MNIGEAARAAGVSAKMVRHYEQIGLIPAADRTEAGYRQYGPRDVAVLRFVRQARLLGFSTEQIGGLIALWSDRTRASRQVKQLAQAHLDDLERKLRELAEMKAALEALVLQCQGDDESHCAILEGLAGDAAPPAQVPEASATRRRLAAGEAPAAAAVAGLMAWTQGLRADPGDGRH